MYLIKSIYQNNDMGSEVKLLSCVRLFVTVMMSSYLISVGPSFLFLETGFKKSSYIS